MDFLPIDTNPSAFDSEPKCTELLEKIRWNGIVTSPFSENSKVYYCQNGNYKCRDTGKYFNVKTNTIFHNSRVSLQKWFTAIWMLSVEKKEITSVDLAKTLGITQKTAWHMQQQIREAFGLKKTKVIRKRKI
jgi:transposase-like protein